MEDHISSLERLLFLTIRLFFFTFSFSIPYCGHFVLQLVRLSNCDNCRFFLFATDWLVRVGASYQLIRVMLHQSIAHGTHSEKAHTFLLLDFVAPKRVRKSGLFLLINATNDLFLLASCTCDHCLQVHCYDGPWSSSSLPFVSLQLSAIHLFPVDSACNATTTVFLSVAHFCTSRTYDWIIKQIASITRPVINRVRGDLKTKKQKNKCSDFGLLSRFDWSWENQCLTACFLQLGNNKKWTAYQLLRVHLIHFKTEQ